ncbi:hypothetical protein CGZ77_09035 [Neisseria sp. KEM232]|nr:hypothetical protein CGZ77_09035 [Neisseria sp. KEM232]
MISPYPARAANPKGRLKNIFQTAFRVFTSSKPRFQKRHAREGGNGLLASAPPVRVAQTDTE